MGGNMLLATRTWVFIATFFFPVVATLVAVASATAQSPVGIYWSESKDAKIQIEQRGDEFFGKLIWLQNPRKDIYNPDSALREREVLGMEILKNFKSDGDRRWTGGSIYDPKNGKTYKCKMWIEENDSNILHVRGFIGISLLGRTTHFQRVP